MGFWKKSKDVEVEAATRKAAEKKKKIDIWLQKKIIAINKKYGPTLLKGQLKTAEKRTA